MEVLIIGIIKGQVFFGIGGCFIATAHFFFFFTSLQMSRVDTGVSTPSLLCDELNSCAAS